MSENKRDDGGQAFPVPGLSGLPNDQFVYGESGMTLRDYFAAKAMQGYWASPSEALPPNATPEGHRKVMCDLFYSWADSMLEARKK